MHSPVLTADTAGKKGILWKGKSRGQPA